MEQQQSEAPFISIRDLCKEFLMGEQVVRALDQVDLEVMDLDFDVVMGPSGSGKSTLLYLLGGLDRPTGGEIQVNGTSINSLDENALAAYRRKTIGFIFQSFNLIQSMTALENVMFPLQFSRYPRSKRQQHAMEMLQRVGLEDRAHHRPGELSGGQQQRVAIARALANDPRLILADEPTGNLDSASGASIMEVLSELHKSGCTVIVVTHDNRMERYATRVIHLLDGRVTETI